MMRGNIVDKINEIDDKLFFLREKSIVQSQI